MLSYVKDIHKLTQMESFSVSWYMHSVDIDIKVQDRKPSLDTLLAECFP